MCGKCTLSKKKEVEFEYVGVPAPIVMISFNATPEGTQEVFSLHPMGLKEKQKRMLDFRNQFKTTTQ